MEESGPNGVAGLSVAARALVPEHTVVHVEQVVMDLGPPHAAELLVFEDYSEFGRASSFAGRRAAARVLAELGLESSPLLADSDGRPSWPTGVAGSITHKYLYAVAVGTSEPSVASLGVDLEFTEELTRDQIQRFLSPGEFGLPDQLALSASDATNLVVAVKEAVYKAQSPVANAELDFHDLAVQPVGADGGLSVRVLSSSEIPAGRASIVGSARGRYCRWGPYWLVYAEIPTR